MEHTNENILLVDGSVEILSFSCIEFNQLLPI